MNASGNGFQNAPKAHQESFTVMLAKMMYDHDMVGVFRWGSGADRVAEQALLTMKGNIYYASSQKGTPNSPGNMINAIFARDESRKQYNVIAYNYNADPNSQDRECVWIVTTLPVPAGTEIRYRNAVYANNSLGWSAWGTETTAAGKDATESVASFEASVPAFSFVKYEIVAEYLP